MDEIPVQAVELKPMSLSELLDRTFTLYRNRFFLFCGIMVIPEIAIMTCSLIVIIGFPIGIIPPLAPESAGPARGDISHVAAENFAGIIVALAQTFLSGDSRWARSR